MAERKGMLYYLDRDTDYHLKYIKINKKSKEIYNENGEAEAMEFREQAVAKIERDQVLYVSDDEMIKEDNELDYIKTPTDIKLAHNNIVLQKKAFYKSYKEMNYQPSAVDNFMKMGGVVDAMDVNETQV
jgi:hypothetical protein